MNTPDPLAAPGAETTRHEWIMAPLRGVTVAPYREAFVRHFGGFDRAVAPFLPTVAGERLRPALFKDVRLTRQEGMDVVPQVIGKDPEALRSTLCALRDLGHSAVDLNAGCPWKFVVRKGRGAGLLADPDRLRRMLDVGCDVLPAGFSVKVRLGLGTPDLLAERVALLNEYPLQEVVIHPRTAAQMYEGRVLLEHFEALYRTLRAPVVYNGDLFTVRDVAQLQRRFPSVRRWMLGRGAVADPFLPAALRARAAGGRAPAASVDTLMAFHATLFGHYRSTLCGPAPVLGRMKELWGMLQERCEQGEALLRRVQRCNRLDEYSRAVNDWREQVGHLVPLRDRIDADAESTADG